MQLSDSILIISSYRELTFEGDMWIDTLTYGLSKVKAKMSEGANLNFIRKMSWEQVRPSGTSL